jgi:mono/diheme cytochrome c family protein
MLWQAIAGQASAINKTALRDVEDGAGMVARLCKLGVGESLIAACLLIPGGAALGPLAAAQTSASSGAASTYKANCAVCHGEDGSGTALGTRLQVKDLRSKEVLEKSSSALAQTIRDGKGNMPAFGDRLDSDQIKHVIEFVRRFSAKGSGAAPSPGK